MLNGDAHYSTLEDELRIDRCLVFNYSNGPKNKPHRKEFQMRHAVSREEYQAKVSEDNGLMRAKIPAPLLRDMKAKPGQYVVFKKTGSGVTIEVKKKKK